MITERLFAFYPSLSFWIFLGALVFGVFLVAISYYWKVVAPRIPCDRVKQDVDPSKWISAEIVGFENTEFLKYGGVGGVVPVNCVKATINIRSQLKFDVVFVYLNGYACVGNEEFLQANLDSGSNIKLAKHGTITKSWLLNIKDRASWEAIIFFPSIITFKMSGIDNKGRQYNWITKEYNLNRPNRRIDI